MLYHSVSIQQICVVRKTVLTMSCHGRELVEREVLVSDFGVYGFADGKFGISISALLDANGDLLDDSLSVAGMESKKRKREESLAVPPLITYHAPGRTFERLFKG